MARRKGYSPYPSAQLSVEQMKLALPRLDMRLDDLRTFDPKEITRRDDPRITALENKIDDFLVKTFGEQTAEYKRYSSATSLDTAGIYVGRTVPLNEVIQGLEHGKSRAIEILNGIRAGFVEEMELAAPATADYVSEGSELKIGSREVFVVHGRDHGTRDAVARFLENIELLPIILDEKANEGRTIHQKFRDHSTVAYAVVLFTPDDIGGPADKSEQLQPRPRQNVIYELGFLSARLGDRKVCVLYSDGVEIPSDLFGVLYVRLDKDGAWKYRLAKEIKAIGVEIDMNKI